MVVSSGMKIEKAMLPQSILCPPERNTCEATHSRDVSCHQAEEKSSWPKESHLVFCRRPAHDHPSSSISHILFPHSFPSSLLVKTNTTTERIGGKETHDQNSIPIRICTSTSVYCSKEACAIPPEDEDEGKVKVCERSAK